MVSVKQHSTLIHEFLTRDKRFFRRYLFYKMKSFPTKHDDTLIETYYSYLLGQLESETTTSETFDTWLAKVTFSFIEGDRS